MSQAKPFVPLDPAAQDAEYDLIFHNALVATLTVLGYEYAITFQDEVRFIWNSRLSPAKLVYFLNRYIPLVNIVYAVYFFMISDSGDTTVCRREYRAIGSLSCFGFISAAAVLCLRAYAVWPSVKFIKGLLVSVYMISISVSAYAISVYVSGASVNDIGPSSNPGRCLVLITNNKVWIAIIVLILCDAVALSLLLARSLTTFRHTHSSLLVVMAKDGLGYFSCVMVLSITNVIVLRVAHPVIRDAFVPTQAALQNALCVRLLLHLHIVNDSQNDAMSVTHDIVFASAEHHSGGSSFP